MPRRIFDRVYGEVYLSDIASSLLNCPEVQRLDAVRQLGGCSFVYPSATHTRLEHSIGVAHLAALMGRHLMTVTNGLVTERDVQCLEIAGLLHDVGHGPFSHLFEEYVHERIDSFWSHEWMSELIIRRVLHGRVPEEDVDLVLLMVSGMSTSSTSPSLITDERRFLLDVVHNCTCGIDVDRLDYLMRDSLSVFGATHSVDARRIVNSARPMRHNGIMCLSFDHTVFVSIEQIFDLRTRLHRQLYQHRDVLLVEDFIKDSLRGKEEHFRACLTDVSAFLALTDASVLNSMTPSDVARLYNHPRGIRVPYFDNSIDVRPRCQSCGSLTKVEDKFCWYCGCDLSTNRDCDYKQMRDGTKVCVPCSATVTGRMLTRLMCNAFERDDIRVLLSDVYVGTPRIRNGWLSYGVLSEVLFSDRNGVRVAMEEQMPRACHHQRSVYCFVCASDLDENVLSHMATKLAELVDGIDRKKMYGSCQHHGEYDVLGDDSSNQM